jgi:hypothetical protein
MMVAADMVDLHLVTAEDVIPNYCECLEKNRSATEHVCMGCGGVRLCSEIGQDDESIRILCKGCFARSTTLRSVRYRSINYTVKILVSDDHKHDRDEKPKKLKLLHDTEKRWNKRRVLRRNDENCRRICVQTECLPDMPPVNQAD